MDRLNSITKQFGLELSDKQIEQFSKYYDILVEWNKVMNLTAITEKEDVIISILLTVCFFQSIKIFMRILTL